MRNAYSKLVQSALTVFIAFSMSSMPRANANVIGFDFGSAFFKVTLVQPGNPFQIVENTTGGRKTESMVTIAPEQRLFGKDSFTGQSRYYQQTFYDVASLLGLEYNEENVQKLQRQFMLNDFAQDERGLFSYQSFAVDKKDEKVEIFTEEMIAMILKYGRELAEFQAKGAVRDAVITVPSYWNQEKRLMMNTAAELAGLKVEQLVHENTAAATMYGIDRMDTEQDLIVLYYNMGGQDTEVSVVRYSAITDNKNKTVEYVEIMGEGCDETLGGQEFDHVLVRILANEFNGMKEREGKPDIRENAKAMRRLYKESGKIKDVLSANKITDVKVPDLADYVTLQFKLDRETYEREADQLFQRVEAPITQALAQAGLTVEDVDQIEILGGGLRVPKVQEIIKEKMNKEELHVHLNGDEAMCFGSAFIASNSSSSFKVRKVYLTQHPQHAFKIEIKPIEPVEATEVIDTPESEDGEEGDKPISYEKEVVLYKTTDYLGQKKTINVLYDRGMRIDVFAVREVEGQEEPTFEPLVSYNLPELDEIAKKDVVVKEGSTKPKVSLNFELTRSHLFKLKGATVSVDETVIEEIIPEKVEVEKEANEKAETDADAENDEEFDDNEEADQTKKTEEENEPESEEKTKQPGEESDVDEEVEKEYKERIENHQFTLDPEEILHGVRLLSKDQFKDAQRRIKSLEKRDDEKKLTDEAKNSYESMIYEFRSFLRDEDNFLYVKEEDREALIEKTEEGEEWLYDAGSDVTYKVYQEKQYDLMSDFSKFKNRKEQAKQRVEEVPQYLEELADTKTRAIEVRENTPWVTEQEQSDLLEKVDETRVWLESMIDDQSVLSLAEDPAFTVADVEAKMKGVRQFAKKVFTKKKPKEPKKKKEEKVEEEETEAKKEEGEEDVINMDDEAFDKPEQEAEKEEKQDEL